jgi:amino acid adenylation domain-containing protein
MSAISPREHEHVTDPVGAAVAAIWQEVLGVPPREETNFIEAGGDSLLATRLILRLNERLGTDLALRAVFDACTVNELTARARRACARATVPGAVQAPEPSSGESSTLSFSQERMWFMHALAGQSAAYNVPLAVRLRGPLDVPRLKAALERTIVRHAMLSMSFPMEASGPRAVFRPSGEVPIAQISVEAPNEEERQAALERHLAELTGAPFDLERGPLTRAALLHVGSDAVLLLVMHHIVTDQWALDILTEELAETYTALADDPDYRPERPPASYERYTAWHRRWVLEHRLDPELHYWRRQLSGLEPLSLTGDYARPRQPGFQGARVRIPIDSRDVAFLTRLGTANRATSAMVLLAVLNVLLYRHTGMTDIAVGMPIANRHHRGSEDLVGVLVNTLVARTDVSGDPNFRTIVARVRAMMLDAFEHQDMPFELLVRELQLAREGNRSPLFSVMFNMLNTPARVAEFGGLDSTRLSVDRKAAQFDLTVTVDLLHDRSICFEYSTNLFARATVERLAQHYIRILHEVAADDATPISSLPMLADDELELLRGWERGERVAAPDQTVTQFLSRSFRSAGDSVALRFGDQALSYEALDLASNRVASALRQRGIGRGSRVGLCLWRSSLTLIAQLGILRSGAAYVPLDPAYPSERIAYMLLDSGLSAIVSIEQLFPVLRGAQARAELIDVDFLLNTDSEQQRSESHSGVPFPGDARPHDAAYVIYTSGSTGKPKGVEVSHRSVVNLLRSMAAKPGMRGSDRLLAVTTVSFDISVLELLLPLAVGAEVTIVSREQLANGAVLAELIRAAGVTVMQATPSMWRMLIDSGWSGAPNLKALVGGEPLSRQLASDLLSRCGEVWNMYGPTETTVWSTCGKVDYESLDRISIGGPIANTCVRVLDANLRRVPIGAAGELFIGGDGVAIGYVNQPELTASRFLDDPLPDRPGSKLYRTGDRARWRHDGGLEHLGRLDSQVKIRGHRIELGEIETRLSAHPEVAGVVACATQDERGDSCVVAYIVPRAGMLEPGRYRAYLQEWLPSYMLPQYFVELDAIPLLANGKVDRSGLADATTEVRKARVTVPPRDSREAAIHRVWREVLANDHFGVNDSFFDLGGHSLLAVRVAAMIAVALDVPCALPMLFRYPTIATLAAALQPSRDPSNNSVTPLRVQGEGTPVFCISGVELYQPLADKLGVRFPTYGLFSASEAAYWGARHELASATPVRDLAADYIAAVRERQPAGPCVLVGFSFGGVIAFEAAQQLTALGVEVPLLVLLDSDPPTLESFSQGNGAPGARVFRSRARAMLDRVTDWTRGNGAARINADQARVRRQRYLAAMRTYSARRYHGRTLLIESTEPRIHDPGHGWEVLVPDIEIHRLACTHREICEPRHVDNWAQRVVALLSESG